MKSQRKCINCRAKFSPENNYIGYYCLDCGLGRREERGAV